MLPFPPNIVARRVLPGQFAEITLFAYPLTVLHPPELQIVLKLPPLTKEDAEHLITLSVPPRIPLSLVVHSMVFCVPPDMTDFSADMKFPLPPPMFDVISVSVSDPGFIVLVFTTYEANRLALDPRFPL